MRKTVPICAALLLACLPVRAQRTSYGERLATADILCSFSSLGVSASLGYYLLDGYWAGELSAVVRATRVAETGEPLGYARVTGGAAWMYRLWSTRSRDICAYAGGDLFMGFESMDPFGALEEGTRAGLLNSGYSRTRFIYGPALRAEAEWFVRDALALTVPVRMPVTLNSAFGTLGFEAGVGIRYNF